MQHVYNSTKICHMDRSFFFQTQIFFLPNKSFSLICHMRQMNKKIYTEVQFLLKKVFFLFLTHICSKLFYFKSVEICNFDKYKLSQSQKKIT